MATLPTPRFNLGDLVRVNGGVQGLVASRRWDPAFSSWLYRLQGDPFDTFEAVLTLVQPGHPPPFQVADRVQISGIFPGPGTVLEFHPERDTPVVWVYLVRYDNPPPGAVNPSSFFETDLAAGDPPSPPRPDPLFEVGDWVRTTISPEPRLVTGRRWNTLGGRWDYQLDGVDVWWGELQLLPSGPPTFPPNLFDLGDWVTVRGAQAIRRVTNLRQNEALRRWEYQLDAQLVWWTEDSLLASGAPPVPNPLFNLGDPVRIRDRPELHTVSARRFREDLWLHQYQMDGVDVWWDEALLEIFPGPIPPPPSPPEITFVERAPRGSGDVLSFTTTPIEPGTQVSLAANVINDDGRRDNILWTASQGEIVTSSWDLATWRAPLFPVDAIIDVILDRQVQQAARVIFEVGLVPPEPEPALSLEEFLSFDFWESQLATGAQILSSVDVGLPAVIEGLGSAVLPLLGGLQAAMDLAPETTANLTLSGMPIIQQGILAALPEIMVPIFGAQLNPVADALALLGIPNPTEIWATFWEGAELFLSPVIKTGFVALFDILEPPLAALLGPLLDPILDIDELGADLKDLVRELRNPSQAIFLPLLGGIGIAMMVSMGGSIVRPYVRAVEHWGNRRLPNELLPVASLVDGAVRGLIPAAMLESQVPSHGLGEDDLRVLIALGQPRLDPQSINLQVLRQEMRAAAAGRSSETTALASSYAGGVTQEAGRDLLALLGYRGAPADALLDQRLQLPGMQDLVRFAVREAFTPDVVAAFDLDADFPADIIPFARGQGFPEQWARMFWRAHWDLPATQQGFAMFQRASFSPFSDGQNPVLEVDGQPVYTVIDRSELELLLRTQDILPFWRGRLTDIAYNVISRVDVRRMYDMAIMEGPEVELTYLSQGYRPEDAHSLRLFVERLAVQGALTARETEARQQYRGGLIDAARAREILSGVVFRDEVLAAILETADLDRAGERTLRKLSSWQTAFRKDQIAETRFRAELQALAVPPDEIDYRVDLVNIARASDDPTPEAVELRGVGRATVARRFREGLIPVEQFAQEMHLLGYTNQEIGRYEALSRIEFETNLTLDLVDAYRAGLRTGRLDEAQFRAQLQALGVASQLVEVYLTADQLRRRLVGPTVEEQEVRALGSGPVLTRFQEGWTTPLQFREEMSLLGYTDPEIDRYQTVAELRFDLDFKADGLGALRDSFNRGIIDGDGFLNRLATLGMDPDRARLHLAREQLRRISSPPREDAGAVDVEIPGA